MQTFKDNQGREWILRLDIGTAKKIRDETHVDLLDPQGVVHFSRDMYALGDALSILCQDQIVERGLDARGFAIGFTDGDVLEAAVTALLEEIVLFTRPAQREPLRRVLSKMRELDQKARAAQLAMVESGAMDRMIDRELAKARAEMEEAMADSGGPSTSSPGFVDSTLAG